MRQQDPSKLSQLTVSVNRQTGVEWVVMKPIRREENIVKKSISYWRDRCARRIGPMNYTQAKMGTSVFQTFPVTDCRILRSTTVRNKFMSQNANASKIRREIMNHKKTKHYSAMKIRSLVVVLSLALALVAQGQTIIWTAGEQSACC